MDKVPRSEKITLEQCGTLCKENNLQGLGREKVQVWDGVEWKVRSVKDSFRAADHSCVFLRHIDCKDSSEAMNSFKELAGIRKTSMGNA